MARVIATNTIDVINAPASRENTDSIDGASLPINRQRQINSTAAPSVMAPRRTRNEPDAGDSANACWLATTPERVR